MITGFMEEMGNTLNSTFAGEEIAQRWSDLFIFERTFQEFKPDLIIELGTYLGALTHFLSLHGHVWSIDNKKRNIKEHQNVKYEIADVFSNDFVQSMKCVISIHSPIFFLCDNGNKIEEFKLYAPLLKKGDIIFVHDWNNEIKMFDIYQTVLDQNLTPYLHELSKKYNSLLRGWIK